MPWLSQSPESAARAILRGIEKDRETIFTSWILRPILLIYHLLFFTGWWYQAIDAKAFRRHWATQEKKASQGGSGSIGRSRLSLSCKESYLFPGSKKGIHMNPKDQTCVVVGGGLAGLVAATVLQRRGFQVTVLDKGRGIGGRLATRRIQDETLGEGVFDYGAQFFTVRNPRFQSWVDQWLKVGVAVQWAPGFVTEDGVPHGVGEPRYRGVQGIRGIAKHLAADLEVHTGTRVVEISWECGRWSACTQADTLFRGDVLVLTPPVPQSLALIHDSGIALSPATKDRLQAVIYEPCLAVLALLRGPSKVPEPGGMWLGGDPIAWIADNHQKGVSPRGIGVTIHAGPGFSQNQWATNDEAVAGLLFTAAARWLGSEVAQYQVHRWRYSKPSTFYGESCLFLNEPGPWVLAGDGLVAPRIEGAFLSGLSAADSILAWLSI